MKKYSMSVMCIYHNVIEADSLEDAINQFEAECPCDMDGNIAVLERDADGNEEFYETDGEGTIYSSQDFAEDDDRFYEDFQRAYYDDM